MDTDSLTAGFEKNRPKMLALATRMLSSRADAEDAVQEAWFRLDRQTEHIDNLGGWLTRVVGRICIDILRSRATRSESALEVWEAELVVTEDTDGPEDAAVVADTLGLALVVVLESLRPDERLAFVLHDLFAVPFAEVGSIIGCSTDAAKMLASRARRKVQGVPLPNGGRQQRRDVVDAFLAAARGGDFDALLRVLDPEMTWHLHMARGRSVQVGANEVLRAVRRGDPTRVEARRVSVNGEPGILAWGPSGRPIALMSCTIVDGRMVDVVSILDPARLAGMDLPAR
ncbi:sigma-70 family RNA polymerase sigma factor [Microbacterium sp. ISL-59]|uniref:sigma-70 family RNA polymerase sigma factor n=1 Tax=Microbacterium sp. ISL-59 TaxID=2819159 RepID=UPI001BE56BF9|nr:sigma-70 family RNA polymerase sigma factor [Microbacterium sp. ISL-59]MBT2496182.1 sigma-70 family RNA polymerase sigma factor [Microbacterium sp. ISL-59]